MAQKTSIYFDHAATSYPKPEIVYRALDENFRKAGNAGRGAYSLALDSARTIFESRSSIAEYLGIQRSEQLVFTPGCTYSINIAIHSWLFWWLSGRKSSDSNRVPNVFVSSLEHNAVMRPLHALVEEKKIQITRLPYKRGSIIDLEELEQKIKRKPKDLLPDLLVIQHGNNVTGEVSDLAGIVKLCREAKIALIIDAAQTAGIENGSLLDLNYDIEYGEVYWCASGHKGLFGPQGVGLLYTNAKTVESLIMGGTGSGSESYAMPHHLPDALEPGTMPVHQIAALGAAADWLAQQDLKTAHKNELQLLSKFEEWALAEEDVQIFSGQVKAEQQSSPQIFLGRLPIASVAIKGISPDRIADFLDREFDIAVRSGLHCNAATHRELGTIESGGLTRICIGPNNTDADVAALCEGLSSLKAKRTN